MIQINKVILKGNLTKDVELKYTSTNKAIARFVLAVNEGYGDNQRTSYINCEVWNKLAENLAKYCGKGSPLLLSGSIRTESFDGQDGNKKYVTKVVVETIEYLDSKKSKNSAENIENTAESLQAVAEKEDPFKDFASEVEITDDMLPF